MAPRTCPGALAAALVLAIGGAAEARPFAVRTAGAATVLAIDLSTVSREGRFRAGWTYELLRERDPLAGRRVQIVAALEWVDCGREVVRHRQVVHYDAAGHVLRRIEPERRWTESLSGSNADLMAHALCGPPDPAWARRQARDVFALYRSTWR